MLEVLLGNLEPGGLVVPPLVVVVHGGQAGVAEGSAGIECSYSRVQGTTLRMGRGRVVRGDPEKFCGSVFPEPKGGNAVLY